MKKLILSLTVALFLFIGVPVSAKEKVPVYMFTKDGCSACLSAQEYFANLQEEYPDLFELRDIVVFDYNWGAVSEDRTNLLIKIYDRFGEDSSKASTPTIVIGDYHSLGLPSDTDEVYDAIVDARDNKTEDVVNEYIEELDLNLEDLLVYEGTTSNTNNDTTDGKYDTIIIIGIFVVLIGGLAGLVIAGNKNN